MSVASQIPIPPPLKTTASNLAADWKRFKSQWLNYAKAAKVDKEDKDCQAAIFLACIGADAYNIFESMEFADENDRSDPDKLLDAFEQHCVGETNEVYERYVFNTRKQEPGETVDAFVTHLRYLIKTCSYGTAEDSMIRDRIVLGIRDDTTRRKLLGTRKLDLSKAIDLCRAQEATTRQFKAITTPDEVHALQHERQPRALRRRSHSRPNYRNQSYNRQQEHQPANTRKGQSDRKCKYCDRKHEPVKSSCPAYQSTCGKCGKKNHWAVVCQSTPKLQENVKQLSEDESLLTLYEANSKRIYANMYVNDTKVRFLVDCGSTVNTVSRSVVETLHGIQVSPPRAKLRMFDKTELVTEGMITATLRHPRTGLQFEDNFYVTASDDPILGINACRRFDLLRVVEENICEIHEIVAPPPSSTASLPSSSPSSLQQQPTTRSYGSGHLTEADVIAQYADLFDGKLGRLDGDVHLEVNNNIIPTKLPQRRLPVAIRDRVEAELSKMVNDGVITPVTEPTPWVSALLVTTKKSDSGIRVLIDPIPLNRALLRSTHYMNNLDDVLPRLSNVKILSTLDMKNGFFHLKLDDASSLLTTFQTPFGRFRYLRVPQGISPAPEIFAAKMAEALSGLRGIFQIADDILCTGSGDTREEAERDHDSNLIALLNRCREKGIKLNRQKLKLHRTSVAFMGHELTNNGLRPSPQKIEAIKQYPVPADKSALHRFIGMCTFLARYCQNFSQSTAVLRDLLKPENEFRWEKHHQEEFEKLKVMLTTAPVLKYYDPKIGLLIQTDASSRGLGSILMQEGKVLEFSSRSLTETEQRYSQIEKELLSIVFSLERYHTYCFANRHVTVETDHRPLLAVHSKGLNAAPKRLQRMLLRLQQYTYTLVFKRGSELKLADALSRAYLQTTDGTVFHEEIAALSTVDAEQEADIRMVASPATIALIVAATDDDEYVRLKEQINKGWPEAVKDLHPDLRPYASFADELATSRGLAYKGHRLIVPGPVRAEILDRLHSAHTGVNACIRRARETVFWPNITADIKRLVSNCATCSRFHDQTQKQPLMSHPVPSRVWERVGVDIFTFGERDYLLTVDYLSGFFEIDKLPSKSVSDIVYCLKQHFARNGLPMVVVTDSSPFHASEFKRFAELYDFQHVMSSPYYHQSNGRAEVAVRQAKRLLTRAREENRDPLLAILEWRNIPTDNAAHLSPAQLSMGRRTRTKLPVANKLLETPASSAASAAHELSKARQAAYYNRGAKDRPSLKVGQTVRVKYNDRTPEWRKAEVAEVLPHRSYNVRFEDGTTRRRTSRHVRFSSEPPVVYSDDDDTQQSTTANRQPAAAAAVAPPAAAKNNAAANAAKPATTTITTRSGRVVKRPSRFND